MRCLLTMAIIWQGFHPFSNMIKVFCRHIKENRVVLDVCLCVDLVWLIKVLYCCLFIAHRQNIQSITPSETYEDPSKWFLNMYWISWLDQSRKEINCLILNQSPYCSSSTLICIKTCSFNPVFKLWLLTTRIEVQISLKIGYRKVILLMNLKKFW